LTDFSRVQNFTIAASLKTMGDCQLMGMDGFVMFGWFFSFVVAGS
jgi:hypothetical protein